MNFTRMMEQLKLTPFTTEDWGYIKEFVTVATPVATALDCLQGDGTSYLGLLLPTIWITKTNITKLLIEDNGTKLKYCKKMAQKMVASLETRFGPMSDDLECRLASGFHPRFRKLFWLDTEEAKTKLKAEMIKAVAELLRKRGDAPVEVAEVPELPVSRGSTSNAVVPVLDAVFANFALPASTRTMGGLYEKNAEKLVTDWCNTEASGTLDDFAFCSDKNFIQLFVRYNTTVCSSAAVERFFSAGRDILRPKRYSMSDATFNALMFLRGNRLWKKKWKM